MKTLRKIIAALLICCAVLPLSACGEVEATEKQLFAMNSAVTIKAYGKNAEAGLNSAASVISALDSSLDPEREGSTLYNINSAAGSGIVITGLDGTPDGYEAIKDGRITGTVAQDGGLMASSGVEAAVTLLDGGTLENNLIIADSVWIDSSNVADYE